ncbi:hypothetical protein PMSD_07460 [Paenibacillus macquariensis subsp. defensor]|nr:hypothetical protein PMSD_07460 [Paenibacillus macquariensis subsp. defensor]
MKQEAISFRRITVGLTTVCILETLLECHQRKYWDASDEELHMLRERFMGLEGELEGRFKYRSLPILHHTSECYRTNGQGSPLFSSTGSTLKRVFEK